ncbi:MAG: methyltransferase domain-containing protein [Bryobacterales bacterium]|nr:methyltransferase domain-containing protein [Bryobacterales bacterium]
MPLPSVSNLHRNPGPALASHWKACGIDRAFLRRMTGQPDNLRRPLTPAREAQFRDDPSAVLLRLFFCAAPTPAPEAEAALGAGLLRATLDCGLLLSDGGLLTAPFHLRLVRGLYLFSDYLNGHSEAVMGAGETTAILYQAGCPVHPVPRALDLGCGAGTLALLLAGTAAQVVGTDINPRAVSLARLNASVNGIGNVEFRHGDGFAPVRGERFDVILSQPPYYPDPRGACVETYLHGGARGDELAWRLTMETPSYLTPTGKAVIFASWTSGRPPIHAPDRKVLELSANRLELHGTRQGITVLAQAAGGEAWHAGREVPADRWGAVTRSAIDEIFAIEDYLSRPSGTMRFDVPPGLTLLSEGSDIIAQGGPRSWVGTAPVDEAIRAVLESPDAGHPPHAIRAALRRGLLTLRDAPP